ncbi:MAG: hypothetical protein A3F24_02465 [Candidatus Colwellbacteria bacterium RIFCSPHIGHO2_12_FULL_44_17]|uniref:UPF0235 protein A3I31_01470 n=2 Tax=Candidatus Colwelliibacteriota TaxID=1817904 RepID=A0A1G1Z871_9BACT|nr:MAG: hypothetical protein A3F24_02465 [Candidatus Colwellbacteria bacterium RIFCSPHIGHO2_12_FULL_44_17]OGY60828.1 MAG: hypothetical protein A3I31_01470 [Candidatus Colwellbacteria bacterium RIFCSPLOWO2_02_FULL_44_20b]
MKLFITAKPNAKETKVEKLSEGYFTVSVKEPPVEGKANAAIVKALADYFKTSQSNIRIVSGFTSRQKIIEIVEK